MDLEVTLATLAHRVDARLDELLPPVSEVPVQLHAAMRYSCLAPGKRLRPALLLLCGGDSSAAVDYACAVEMIHAFSLIHDDLPAIDNDSLRRGRPTCHIQYSEGVAILAGDALFALAFQVVASADSPANTVVKVMQILADSVGSNGLVGGETIDILSQGQSISQETLATIHDRKTAALIRASCEIGAVVANLEPAPFREYGRKIGLAFQIADDVLNVTGTEAQLGKPAGSDQDLEKATYPKLFGIEASKQMALELAQEAAELVADAPNGKLLAEIATFAVTRLR